MSVNPGYRAPSFIITEADEVRILAQLQSIEDLAQGDPKDRPPLKYLIAGLHDITASRKVGHDERKHPHVIAGKYSEPAAPATDAELISLEKELTALRKRITPGSVWHYDAYTLWENLDLLKRRHLIFPSLAKDE